MSIASKYNRTGNLFPIDSENFEFISLEELYRKVGEQGEYQLLGVFVNSKTRFGEQPVAIIDGFKVNLPKHMTETVKAIMADPEDVAEINAGKVGFVIYKYFPKGYNTETYSIRFTEHHQ